MKFIGWIASGAVALIALSGCGGGQGQAVAKIGDKTVTQQEYLQRTEKMLTPVGFANNQLSTRPAGYEALLQMVREQVLLDMAQKEGVAPTEQQVEERVQRLMKEDANLKRMVTEQKILSLDDVRRQVRAQLIQFNLLTKGVTVTEQEVKKFYEQNKRNFYRPATAQVQVLIVTNRETRAKIDEDLRKGLNLRSVAQKYSQNPAAGVQLGESEVPLEGPFPNNPQGAFLARLAEILKPLKPGETSDWIQADANAFVRIFVVSKNPGRQLPYEEVKDRIREGLMLQKGQQTNRDLNEEIARRMLETKVEIFHPQWKEQYQKDMEELRKALEELQKQKQAAQPSGQAQSR